MSFKHHLKLKENESFIGFQSRTGTISIKSNPYDVRAQFGTSGISSSCGACNIHSLHGKITEWEAYEILAVLFKARGCCREYINFIGFAFISFSDLSGNSRLSELKKIFTAHEPAINPNTSNSVTGYSLSRKEFQVKYTAYKKRLKDEERASIAASKSQKVSKPTKVGTPRKRAGVVSNLGKSRRKAVSA